MKAVRFPVPVPLTRGSGVRLNRALPVLDGSDVLPLVGERARERKRCVVHRHHAASLVLDVRRHEAPPDCGPTPSDSAARRSRFSAPRNRRTLRLSATSRFRPSVTSTRSKASERGPRYICCQCGRTSTRRGRADTARARTSAPAIRHCSVSLSAMGSTATRFALASPPAAAAMSAHSVARSSGGSHPILWCAASVRTGAITATPISAVWLLARNAVDCSTGHVRLAFLSYVLADERLGVGSTR